MPWKITVFETGRGDKPVEIFLRSLSSSALAKTLRLIDLLEKYGNTLSMPHVKFLKDNLFELRVRGKEEVRVLFAILGKNIFLLHAFKKKSQKTPQKELKTALQRLELVLKKR